MIDENNNETIQEFRRIETYLKDQSKPLDMNRVIDMFEDSRVELIQSIYYELRQNNRYL